MGWGSPVYVPGFRECVLSLFVLPDQAHRRVGKQAPSKRLRLTKDAFQVCVFLLYIVGTVGTHGVWKGCCTVAKSHARHCVVVCVDTRIYPHTIIAGTNLYQWHGAEPSPVFMRFFNQLQTATHPPPAAKLQDGKGGEHDAPPW